MAFDPQAVLERYPFLGELLVRRTSSGPLCIEQVEVGPLTRDLLRHKPSREEGLDGEEYEEMYLVHVGDEGRWRVMDAVHEPLGQALLRVQTELVMYVVSISNIFQSVQVRFRRGRIMVRPVETFLVSLYTLPPLGVKQSFAQWVEAEMGLVRA